MNEDTLIVVHCYAGDAEVVKSAMPVHIQHKRPILILSPEDAPVTEAEVGKWPKTYYRSGGKRGYFGQESLDRQVIHLRMLLETEHRYFLLNDSDSACLSPEIPRYLYEEAEGTVWSTVVRESRPHKSPYPKVAFHPPYFVERATIERMLEVADRVETNPITPFIDWFMVAMTVEADLKYKSYPNGRSFPAWRHGDIPETKKLGHDYVHEQSKQGGRDGARKMETLVQRGVVMVHSVKHPEVLGQLKRAHEHFRALGSPPDLLPTNPEQSYAGISIVVPFREDSSGTRTATWEWLKAYYEATMPDVEILIGRDDGMPYSKSVAVNEAVDRASGYIIVIMDADVLIDPAVIRECADKINRSPKPLWFVPFTRAYRMNQEASLRLQALDPAGPVPMHDPTEADIEDKIDHAPGFIHILSRRAFNRVGGYDPRFRGWGGEDTSFVLAVGTLYAEPTRLPSTIRHLWHDRPGAGSASHRRWDGQTERKRDLWREYKRVAGNKNAMRALIRSRETDT